MSEKLDIRSIGFTVVPQIMKQLIRSLCDCQASFTVNTPSNHIAIERVKRFWLSDGQYGLTFYTHSQTVDATVFIALENVTSFTT